ncbi:MAG: ATP-binding protein [Terrimicrobiaceae bacterium]
MEGTLSLRIKNLLEEIPPATELAAQWLVSRGVPRDETCFARLAIDETVSNCVKYGYDDSSEHHIEIELVLASGELMIAITDDGHFFNPLDHPEPDTSLPIEERPVGGLGIHLLRKMADHIEYERSFERNRLRIHKSITASSSP